MIGRTLNRLGGVAASLAYPLAGLVAIAAPQPALASDWGCQVILCLATPGSPTTYAECVPPITKLWQVLATPGGAFPTCDAVGISTRKGDHGYDLTVRQTDGSVSRYRLDTRYQSVTPR